MYTVHCTVYIVHKLENDSNNASIIRASYIRRAFELVEKIQVANLLPVFN